MPDFAATAEPLTDLTKGNQPTILQWSNMEQVAFETLCSKTSEAPVLIVPRPGQPFVLYSDASNIMVASQYDNENAEHAVAYASLKLTVPQCALKATVTVPLFGHCCFSVILNDTQDSLHSINNLDLNLLWALQLITFFHGTTTDAEQNGCII